MDDAPREVDQDAAKVIHHGLYITFQLTGVAISRALFAEILDLIADLRAPPLHST